MLAQLQKIYIPTIKRRTEVGKMFMWRKIFPVAIIDTPKVEPQPIIKFKAATLPPFSSNSFSLDYKTYAALNQ